MPTDTSELQLKSAKSEWALTTDRSKDRILQSSCRGRCHGLDFKIKEMPILDKKKLLKTNVIITNTDVCCCSGPCSSGSSISSHCMLTGHRFCLFAQRKHTPFFYLPFNPFAATTCCKMWKFLSHTPLLSSPPGFRYGVTPLTRSAGPPMFLVSRPPCWHQDTKTGGSPTGPVIGPHHPGNETSLIRILLNPDKNRKGLGG